MTANLQMLVLYPPKVYFKLRELDENILVQGITGVTYVDFKFVAYVLFSIFNC